MAAHDIEYVELYSYDKNSTVDYFVSSLGFTVTAETQEHDKDGNRSVLLRQGTAQVIVTTGPGAREFLDQHGDGVADIAVTCDDVAATRDAAMAAGATVAGPEKVMGFGAVSHTLLPASIGHCSRLPAGRSWRTIAVAREQHPVRIKCLDHVAVCVEPGSLARYADFYSVIFELSRYSGEYVEYGDQAMDSVVIRSPSGGITFTLVASEPATRPGQLDAFIDRNGGPGVQHLAFEVDDIVYAIAEFRERGVEFLDIPDAYYEMLRARLSDLDSVIPDLRSAGVLADRDDWGYLYQLFTKSPYDRNTLFYEIIQRRGARGFGSSNIRALYEAVDRTERLAAG